VRGEGVEDCEGETGVQRGEGVGGSEGKTGFQREGLWGIVRGEGVGDCEGETGVQRGEGVGDCEGETGVQRGEAVCWEQCVQTGTVEFEESWECQLLIAAGTEITHACFNMYLSN